MYKNEAFRLLTSPSDARILEDCCGRGYVFPPTVLFCYGKKLCTIPRNAEYWILEGSPFQFCRDCYSYDSDPMVTLNGEFLKSNKLGKIRKKNLKLVKNNCEGKINIDWEESTKRCMDCKKIFHQVCVNLLDSEVYTCDQCLKKKGQERKQYPYKAKGLRESELGSFLEKKVNSYLMTKDNTAKNVIIRVIANRRNVKVDSEMQLRYNWPEEIPYQNKLICAFQEIDGVDVFFFGMYVQEYGSESPPQNARKVYITYIDSLPYFEPKCYKTEICQEIILNYLLYVKQQGYTTAHLWACPVTEVTECLFRSHPPEQKLPTPENLRTWFKKLFDKGMEKGIILNYKDILQHIIDTKIKSISQLPYFDEDLMPVLFKKCILEFVKFADNQFDSDLSLLVTKASIMGQENLQSLDKWQLVDYKSGGDNKTACFSKEESNLLSEVCSVLERYKKMFSVVTLNPSDNIYDLPPINDVDLTSSHDIALYPEIFMQYQTMNNLHFTSLRLAKYTTKCLVDLIHFMYQIPTCKHCKREIDSRYRCTVCDDNFVLCTVCFKSLQSPHAHKMEKLGVGLDEDNNTSNLEELFIHGMTHQYISHGILNSVIGCNLGSCEALKKYFAHLETCKGLCSLCYEFKRLFIRHAFNCIDDDCPITMCKDKKEFKKKQQNENEQYKEWYLKRKVDKMQYHNASVVERQHQYCKSNSFFRISSIVPKMPEPPAACPNPNDDENSSYCSIS